MAGFSDAVELEILDHAFGGLTWTAPAQSWIQLHIGAGPTSANGTLNIAAGNAVRKQVTWNIAAGDPSQVTNNGDIDWTTGEVTLTEVYAHFTIWDASTNGNYIAFGTISGGSVTAGNAFKIADGQLSFQLQNV